MSTAHILYYSGTGNTYRALGIVAEALRARGYEPAWHNLAKGLPPLGADSAVADGAPAYPAEGDLVLIGFPALGFCAPEPVLRALRGLPRLVGLRAAVLCACGGSAIGGKILRGWAGAAVPEIERLLRRKGMTVLASAEARTVMPLRLKSRSISGTAAPAQPLRILPPIALPPQAQSTAARRPTSLGRPRSARNTGSGAQKPRAGKPMRTRSPSAG